MVNISTKESKNFFIFRFLLFLLILYRLPPNHNPEKKQIGDNFELTLLLHLLRLNILVHNKASFKMPQAARVALKNSRTLPLRSLHPA